MPDAIPPGIQSRRAGAAGGESIAVYAMNFAPELTGCGRYTGELADFLRRRGHRIEVFTTVPHYPGWAVRAPFRGGRFYRERAPAADIWRCPLWMSEDAGGLKRLLSPLTFALSSAPVALWRMVTKRPRVVMVIEPTLAVAPVALVGAWLAGARTVLHVQDLEVDAAFAVGHLRLPGWITRLIFAAERLLLRRFDAVVTISTSMADQLRAKGVAPDRVHLVRNWVDTTRIAPLAEPSPYRAELGLGADDFVVLYAGQIGRKQSLGMLFAAARALADERGITFVVAGDGPLRRQYMAEAADLPRVRFLPLQPEERLNDLLGLADLHVLPQDEAVADLVLPSKLGGMLASGRPILATAAPDSEVGRFLGPAATLVAPADLPAAIRRAAAAPPPGPAPALALAHGISAEKLLPELEAVLLGRAVEPTPVGGAAVDLDRRRQA